MENHDQTTTHFGYKTVDINEKKKMVAGVFSSVASKYDIMNDVMSFGLHRMWKATMLGAINPANNMRFLDLAGGTGDISFKILNKAKARGKNISLTMTDINEAMLEEGKGRAVNKNLIGNIDFKIVDAENIPFEDNSFDYVTIAFGIRNVTDIQKVLNEVHRVLKPGGKFVCLEFSNVNNAIVSKFYDAYSFILIPKFGKVIANDEASYQYLVESIRKFPEADKFKEMMDIAGLKKTNYQKLTFGVVAIHTGWKI